MNRFLTKKEFLIFLIFLIFPLHVGATTQKEFYPGKYAAVVIDANTNRVLFQENANRKRYPASLTKMMTLYLLFDSIEKRRISLNTKMPVSKKAANQKPTKLGLTVGEKISVKDAIQAIVTRSANDAAMVIAEYVGGSEKKFVQMMNHQAKKLRMYNTSFHNPTGLPNIKQYSTAKDLAVLSIALRRDFIKEYSFFSITNFVFEGQMIRGHDSLIGSVRGVDGIKTGYINMSGYNLATSVSQDNRKLNAVIMGGRTASLRDFYMKKLIAEYFPKTTPKRSILKLNSRPRHTHRPTPLPTFVKKSVPKIKNIYVQNSSSKNYHNPKKSSELKHLATAENRAQSLNDEHLSLKPQRSSLSDWSIQIGSLPTQEQAQSLIQKARTDGEMALKEVFPSTKKINVNKKIYYRARFLGFYSQKEANNACKALVKKGFDCYSIANQTRT